MTINRATIVIFLLALELTVFSLRFIKLEPEKKLLPSVEAGLTISDRNGYRKLNGSCSNPPNFNFNQVNLLNSQNINGYNPIFPKRLLKIVNASLGRDVNWVETVSLSVDFVDGSVFRLAGVVPCKQNTTETEMPSPRNNIFSKMEIMDDDVFYSLVRTQPQNIGKLSIIVLKSDEILTPKVPRDHCSRELPPEVSVTGANEIKIKSECDFYYVHPQLYYQGWAMFDEGGRIGESFPAFGFLQGYKIPAGERKIRFAYTPFTFILQTSKPWKK